VEGVAANATLLPQSKRKRKRKTERRDQLI
jgi:hypothetical protein